MLWLVACGLVPLACFALLLLVVWRDDCTREDAAPPFMQAGKDRG